MKRRKVLFGALFCVPAMLQAQTSANVNLSNMGYADIACTNGPSTRIDAPGAVATSCSSLAGRLNASGSSSNVNGILRSQTSISLGGGDPLTFVRASADAEWYDILQFTAAPGSVAATRVELRYLLSGSMSGQGQVLTTANLLGFSGNGTMGLGKTNLDPGGGLIPSQSFSEYAVWGLNIQNGRNEIGLDLTLTTMVQGTPGVNALSGFSDFSHTVGLTNVNFFDANNNDVTSTMTYKFANGLQFMPSTTVPEPSTWTMMLGGLVCMGAVAKRRVR